MHYRHKIIGKNIETFVAGMEDLQRAFPRMNLLEKNLSRNEAYISVTYELRAENADEIITLWIKSEKIEGMVTIF